MTNSHYISRFLTIPWEHGNRDLTYYDFKTKTIYTQPSKGLYAKHGLFSDAFEKFLNEKTERLASKERDALASGKREYSESEFRSFRALVLLVLLQGGRSAAMKSGKDDVSRILSFSEQQLDQLVLATMEQFSLATLTMSSERRLYYPDTGVFPALVNHAGVFECLICLPITPQCALTLMPVRIDPEVSQG